MNEEQFDDMLQDMTLALRDIAESKGVVLSLDDAQRLNDVLTAYFEPGDWRNAMPPEESAA